jgi:hypothetical protein
MGLDCDKGVVATLDTPDDMRASVFACADQVGGI